jgi:hypothetical protein
MLGSRDSVRTGRFDESDTGALFDCGNGLKNPMPPSGRTPAADGAPCARISRHYGLDAR